MYKIRLQRHFFKLATNEWSDKTFLLPSKLCPPGGGFSARAPGLYTCIKSWKKCIKSDFKEIFFKLVTSDRSDKMFLLASKFHPQGVVRPWLNTCIKSWEKIYKIRLQRDFFETSSKWPKWQEVSFVIKILSPGIVCPWPAALYIY